MQPELLPVPPSDETDEALKARIERLYRIHGQNWQLVFPDADDHLEEKQDAAIPPWWLLRRIQQLDEPRIAES